MTSDKHAFLGPLASLAALLLLAFAAPVGAQQQQAQAQAHTHGRLTLDLVVEGPSIAITMVSPVDNLVGFEHAPRIAAEKKAAADAIEKLRESDDLFAIDTAAGCKAGRVDIRSAVLGLGKVDAYDAYDAQGQDHMEGHADLSATFSFICTRAAAARFIDMALFTSFRNLQQIDVQIAAPQGQFKRTLKRPNLRLAWGK